MNYTDVVKEFAREGHLTIRDAKELLKVLESIVISHARDDGGIKLFSSGLTVTAKYVDAHIGRNPATGEEIKIPAKYKVGAKFGKPFKEAVNE